MVDDRITASPVAGFAVSNEGGCSTDTKETGVSGTRKFLGILGAATVLAISYPTIDKNVPTIGWTMVGYVAAMVVANIVYAVIVNGGSESPTTEPGPRKLVGELNLDYRTDGPPIADTIAQPSKTERSHKQLVSNPMRPQHLKTLIIFVGVSLLAGLALYVPWMDTFDNGAVRSERSAGYYLIFSPPRPIGSHRGAGVRIDWPRVVIPMAVVIVAMVAGVWLVSSAQDAKS